MLNEPKVVGHPVSRVDGPLKVAGKAHYAAEYYESDMLHGYIVPATIASGQIASIDVAEAERFPGVVKIYTHENRPPAATFDSEWRDKVAPPGNPFRPLERREIQFDGQPVALVVAESFEQARDAAALVRVTYAAKPAHTDIVEEYPGSYTSAEKRSGIPPTPKPRGDAQGAFDAASIKVSADYGMAGEHHNPMELFASTVLWQSEGQLTIYEKTQGSQPTHEYVCKVFGLDPDRVKVVNAFVGGAFGSALRPKPQLFLAVMASLDLKRSVKVEMNRRDMFYLTWRPASVQTVSLACDRGGNLQSVMHDAVSATSTYEDYQEVIVNWSGLAYRCDNVKLSYKLAKLDMSTPGDMRAPGAVTGVFALECAMDELAYAADIDPLELRIQNFVDRDQNDDKQLTSNALKACYEEGAKAFGWDRRTMPPRSMRDGKELVGWGVATGVWDASLMAAEAKVRLSSDGSVTVSAAATDIGTGTYTILAQLAAEEFGVEAADVTVLIGDSSLPTTSVEGGSWTAASSGSAVEAASTAVRKTLLRHALAMDNSALKGATPDDVAIRDHRLVLASNNQIGIAISDIMEACKVSFIEELGKAAPDEEQKKTFASYTHSAVFAEARVDEELGVVRISRVVTAIAAGRILNPKTARSQILGGVVMGIGAALHEEAMLDDRTGRIMNHNLAEYHIPTHADIRNIEVIFVEEQDDKASPIGVKGLGEIGIVGVAPAIANAVFHATGKRIRSLPITLDKILSADDGMTLQ
ncbi:MULTISPECIES: xanthine dehydrogenase family protein molybdopterin-binding subunit [unclassified Sinorhizobium]|uniref:xanthine dehydrogenase family protein molybdopterin-binding subunit n=1 Tax=unclassified Sinorhizobium TaxID=2613772 RepID=UPI003524C851